MKSVCFPNFCHFGRNFNRNNNDVKREPPEIYRRFSKIRKNGVIGILRDNSAGSNEPRTFQKNLAVRLRIKQAIYKNDFFGNFDNAQLNALVAAMYPKEILPNTRIIQEGDNGYHMYVSDKGTFDVYEGNYHQFTFGPGVAFGEFALLYNTKRLQSIDVKEGGRVWVLERSTFHRVMMSCAEKVTKDNIDRLKKIPIFQSLPNPVLYKISDIIQVEFFSANSRIFDVGKPEGSKMCLINSGKVRITKIVDDVGEEIVIGKGDFFGEVAFDSDFVNCPDINAVALSPGVECFTINRRLFLNYIGDLKFARQKYNFKECTQNAGSSKPTWKTEFSNFRLNDFEVKETLGVGAFGRVELVASSKRPGESFALKKLKKIGVSKARHEEIIFNEKETMQACDSPFICKLYQTFKDSTHVYFLMEVCLGGDLCSYIARTGRIDNGTARFVTACIVEAVNYLHNLNIIYRDLKPDNVMIDNKGYLKLTDFGSSKRMTTTKLGEFVGTPEYMAPEMVRNKSYDRSVDFWSLGIVLHELLLGYRPFDDPNNLALYNTIVKGIDVIGIHGTVNKNAEELIRGLLRPNPPERLGNLRNGIMDIQLHKWFDQFDWNSLRNLTLPSPIVPKIRNPLDTRYFERFAPDREALENDVSGWDAEF